MFIFVTTSKRNNQSTIYERKDDFNYLFEAQEHATKILNSSEDISKVEVFELLGSVSYVTRPEWVN